MTETVTANLARPGIELPPIPAPVSAGSLGSIRRVVKRTVFVASQPEITGQPFVANGASQLLLDIFGDEGRHARSAVGVAALPLNAPVEIELTTDIGDLT